MRQNSPQDHESRKTIIVTDDDPSVRSVIRFALESRGYGVIEASDGSEVLRLSELRTASLLITDIVMPNVEGTELIMQVRRSRPELPILALSGGPSMGRDVYLTVASKVGAQRTLAKPFAPSVLLQVVHELLGD
ncbi:MAG: response regulator [Planctomycetes bacterium]|nr:response regulator [Planctomycetota bacterium]